MFVICFLTSAYLIAYNQHGIQRSPDSLLVLHVLHGFDSHANFLSLFLLLCVRFLSIKWWESHGCESCSRFVFGVNFSRYAKHTRGMKNTHTSARARGWKQTSVNVLSFIYRAQKPPCMYNNVLSDFLVSLWTSRQCYRLDKRSSTH